MDISNIFKKKKSNVVKNNILITDPHVPFSVVESYKSLRTNLLFSLSVAVDKKKTVIITSSNPGEGKSTAAVNLSIALSDAGNKTLLIDGDLRRPVIHSFLKLANDYGLSNVLAGFKKEDEVIKPYYELFDVILAGAAVPNPSELLSSEAMKNLLSRLEEKYDYIIIDTPPVNVVTDAIALAPFAAGVILMVKAESTSYPDLEKVLAQLEFSGVKIFGLVLNSAANKKHLIYSKYGFYGKYKSYGYKNYGYKGYN
ncbi:MAG: CpsD/CapB family tyrosine-protein kinase [Clostridiales bacterium]